MYDSLNKEHVKYNVELLRFNTWKVGGKADILYKPSNVHELTCYLRNILVDEQIHILGLGSNCLISDSGLRGHTLVLHPGLNDCRRIDANKIYVGSGMACANLARFCARNDFAGAEFLATIPGTLGGALVMNAGCFGSEIWELIELVEVLDRKGKLSQLKPSDFDISYRHVAGVENFIFVGAILRLDHGSKATSLSKIRDFLRIRADTQPTGQSNCGSVFKNPPNDFAGRLIDVTGLKGLTVGGASVSIKHANFILNDSSSKAAHISQLIKIIQGEVSAKFSVKLIPEVKFLGEFVTESSS